MEKEGSCNANDHTLSRIRNSSYGPPHQHITLVQLKLGWPSVRGALLGVDYINSHAADLYQKIGFVYKGKMSTN